MLRGELGWIVSGGTGTTTGGFKFACICCWHHSSSWNYACLWVPNTKSMPSSLVQNMPKCLSMLAVFWSCLGDSGWRTEWRPWLHLGKALNGSMLQCFCQQFNMLQACVYSRLDARWHRFAKWVQQYLSSTRLCEHAWFRVDAAPPGDYTHCKICQLNHSDENVMKITWENFTSVCWHSYAIVLSNTYQGSHSHQKCQINLHPDASALWLLLPHLKALPCNISCMESVIGWL